MKHKYRDILAASWRMSFSFCLPSCTRLCWFIKGIAEVSGTIAFKNRIQYANDWPQNISTHIPMRKAAIRVKAKRTRWNTWFQRVGGDGEIRTLAGFYTPTAFRVQTLQPLGYISEWFPLLRPAIVFHGQDAKGFWNSWHPVRALQKEACVIMPYFFGHCKGKAYWTSMVSVRIFGWGCVEKDSSLCYNNKLYQNKLQQVQNSCKNR